MNLIKFAQIVGKLKTTKRTGWVNAGIKNPESVAEHSYRLAVLCMILGDQLKLNTEKIVRMALIDDLAESVVGDLVIKRGNKTIGDKGKKFQLEEKAIKEIFSNIDNGQEYVSLWQEAQAGDSKEFQVLKQLDKLEMAMQALEYEDQIESKKLDEFWITAQNYTVDKKLKLILKKLSKLRSKN
ncbi:HD domain-containing protein [Candidatus Curtissbacteria bacterium]|nr:HD domain-containing protein [Candidatus Curtissbacteria bacterium]